MGAYGPTLCTETILELALGRFCCIEEMGVPIVAFVIRAHLTQVLCMCKEQDPGKQSIEQAS